MAYMECLGDARRDPGKAREAMRSTEVDGITRDPRPGWENGQDGRVSGRVVPVMAYTDVDGIRKSPLFSTKQVDTGGGFSTCPWK